jgi:pectate lyase
MLKNFPMSIFTHDIIIRGLRIRPGDENIHNGADVRDCISILTGSHHVMVDHCSFSWGIDENVSVWGNAEYVTLQWNIISEGLYRSIHPKGPHSMGLIIANGANKTSVHHNLLAHNNGRNPLVMGGTNHEFISNVIYDWGYSSEFFENGSQLKIDIAGNYWKPRTSNVDTSEMPLNIDFDSTTTMGSQLYCKNNLYMGITFLNAAQLQNLGGNAVLISDSSLLDSAGTVSFDMPIIAYDTVLARAGALHPQRDSTDSRVLASVDDSTAGLVDCMLPYPILLDSGEVMYGTDSSIVYSQLFTIPAISAEARKVEIAAGTGAGQVRYGVTMSVIDSVLRIVEAVVDTAWTIIPDSTSVYKVIVTCDNAVGGWGSYAGGSPLPDADHDGMPDLWEMLHGLNPNDSTDHNGTDLDSTGYTNLDVYLNEFYMTAVNPSINEINSEELQFTLYPNPFNSSATLKLNHTVSCAELNFYNVLGKVVRAEKNISGNIFVFRRNELPEGIYFLQLTQGNKTIMMSKAIIIN